MTEVALGDNRISSVLESELAGTHGVRVLELQGNRIDLVEANALQPLRRDLVHLDLSRNRLQKLGGCVRLLGALASLNLTDNWIESFMEGEFMGLNELMDLYMGQNRIISLGLELQTLPQLQYLVISMNRIRTIRTEQLPRSIKYLYMHGNPFKCDCALLPFLMHLNSTSGPGTDGLLCLSPENSKAFRCPIPCSCACSISEEPFIEVNCENRNLTEIPILFSNASYEDTGLLSVTLPRKGLVVPFFLEDAVGVLDLSHNHISSLDRSHLPSTLRTLRLDSNFMTNPFVPESMHLLKTISLGHNPWTCDCSTLQFKKWILSKSDVVDDLNSTNCGPGHLEDNTIWMMTDMDLCPTDVGFYISLAFSLLSVCLLLAGTMIAWSRWSVQLRVWLYAKGLTWAKERDMDREKLFDAFLSFSHKDSDFVIKQIIYAVEQRAPNVRLCLHYKHFVPGELIQNNIINAVHASKRTVLVLSRNFLESEWCLFEFRAAHVQALRDRIHRVVVVKVGELPDDLLDPELRLYLNSTTYLTWGEGSFWDNLLYVLPTTSTSAFPMSLDIVEAFKI